MTTSCSFVVFQNMYSIFDKVYSNFDPYKKEKLKHFLNIMAIYRFFPNKENMS